MEKSAHILCIPHEAIPGLEGIFDGREILTEVSIETTKNPHNLSREDSEYTINTALNLALSIN